MCVCVCVCVKSYYHTDRPSGTEDVVRVYAEAEEKVFKYFIIELAEICILVSPSPPPFPFCRAKQTAWHISWR